ncbi:hypothetical protein [Streptomyces sp. NPDC002057]|uniref:hypothetical protein n=1 Tax=Streptomyces sp. NPDC002057 TaxID=3154664 RepID=UPI00331ABD29
MFRAKKLQAALLAVTTVAGLAVSAAPAQASTCYGNGGAYICEYGVSRTTLADGTAQEYVVGTDNAVWANRARPDGTWKGWVSLGGWVKSRIEATPRQESPHDSISISATGMDGKVWFRVGRTDGSWGTWQMNCYDRPNGPYCP